MMIGGDLLITLALLALTTVGIVWSLYLLWYRDIAEASGRTRARGKGLLAGAGSVAAGAGGLGLDLLINLPELAITAWGSIAILGGISVKVFAAVAIVVYVVAEMLNGGPAGA